MLFRDSRDPNDVGAIGSRPVTGHGADDDETASTGESSYTSAASSTAQSFELRMAQLSGNAGASGASTASATTHHRDVNTPGDLLSAAARQPLLSTGYQLFPTATGDSFGALTSPEDRTELPQSLSLVPGMEAGGRHAANGNAGGSAALGTQATDYTEEDERDDDYLAALLSDIERHAARLDTQFYRYPSAEAVKQQLSATTAAAAAASAAHESTGTAEGGGDGANGALSLSPTAATSTATTAPSVAVNPNGAHQPTHSTGTKLFLGGLRYEVIQSGRQTVSWIFRVACGVQINPSSILIHRKTKNGRSNVAPTGCASVFVANESDVATLLSMNQRIYCAEEGVYVSPSPDVMKELIASKDIVDVTGGRVRGPTHPVVIERAYSVSNHHSHRASGNGGGAGTGVAAAATGSHSARSHGNGTGAGGSATGSPTSAPGGSHHGSASRHTRTPSSVSAESALSNKIMGGMPPPYGGAVPPQYGNSTSSSFASGGVGVGIGGCVQPPSYAPFSQASSTNNLAGMPMSAGGRPLLGGTSPHAVGSGGAYSDVAVPAPYGQPSFSPGAQSSSSSQGDASQLFTTPGAGGTTGTSPGALKLDPQRVTFHAYLRQNSASRASASPNSTKEEGSDAHGTSAAAAGSSGSPEGATTVLFLAALPADATGNYVSWLFSLMAITLPSTRIHIIGGQRSSTNSPVLSPNSAASGPTAAGGGGECCATVSISREDVSIALNFHHRILCTSRGVWVGHTAQDIAALRASDPLLQDIDALHVDRRMTSPATGGAGNSNNNTASATARGAVAPPYPHALAMAGLPAPAAGDVTIPLPPPPNMTGAVPAGAYPSHLFGAVPFPGGVVPVAPGAWGFNPSLPLPPSPMTAAAQARPGVPRGKAAGPRANVSGTAAGAALPLPSLPLGMSPYSMPPPPPPFPFTQSVTIGDRTYTMPTGAAMQYVPVLAPGAVAPAAPGETGRKATSGTPAAPANARESANASSGQLHSVSPHSSPRS